MTLASDDAKVILAAINNWRAEQRTDAETLRRDYDAKHAEIERKQDDLRREMIAVSAMVKTAVPDGDIDGHRRYHELLIEREQDRKTLRKAVLTHLLKSSTLAAATGALWVLIMWVKEWMKK